jgi:anti-sigma factor RsiW
MDYSTGELAPDTLAQFERHLSRCANCRAYLAQYRATIAISRGASLDERDAADAGVPEDLVRAILAARTGSRHDT